MRIAKEIVGTGMLSKIAGIAVLIALMMLFMTFAGSLAQAFSVEFTPSEVPVCGPYPNISMVTAKVLNNESYTLTNISFSFTVNQSGLTSISGGTYHLDSLAAGSYSPVMSWVFGCSQSQSGAYKAYLAISSSEGSYSSEPASYTTIRVIGEPPKILSLNYSKPAGGGVEISATTNKDSFCKLSSSNVGYDSMVDYMVGSARNHTLLLNPGQGTYTYYVLCKDTAGNTMITPGAVTFSTDSTKPTVSINLGTSVFNTEDVSFNVTTSENSVCEMNMLYPGTRKVLLSGSGLLHLASLSLDEGFYTWQMRCSDPDGNVGETAFSLEVNLPPTVDIEIDTNRTRLGTGVYKVSVAASENLAEPPQLKQVVEGTRKDIPLEGSKRDWSGYMIIEKQGKDIVGSFEITCMDARGNVGHGIDSGSSFIIDTTPPPAPQDLEGQLAGGKISLDWYYAGEDIDYFNFYRSDKQYVGLADFRARADGLGHSDSINTSAKEYYYAISAVDLAGNEGPLSAEIRVEVIPEEKHELEMADGSMREVYLSNVSLSKIESALSEAGKLRFDLESANLAGSSEEKDIMAELGIQTEIDSAISTLKSIESELDIMRFSRLKDFEVDSRLEVYLDILKGLESAPSKVSITEVAEYVQIPEVDSNRIADLLQVEGDYRKEYLKAAEPYLSGPEIEKKITQITISHLNGLKEYKTLVKERFSSGPDNVAILIIPASAPEFEVLNTKYRTINSTLLVFSTPGLGDITYVVNDTLDKDGANRFYALSIPDYSANPAASSSGSNSVTGRLTGGLEKYGLTKGEAVVIITGLVAIAILLVYYLVFAKGFKASELMEYPSLKDMQQSAETELSELQKIVGKDPAPAEEPEPVPEEIKKDNATPAAQTKEEGHAPDIDTAPADKPSGEKQNELLKEAKTEEARSGDSLLVEKSAISAEKTSYSAGKKDGFVALITELEAALDMGKREEAARDYSLLMGAYASLPKDKKAMHYKRCIEVHKRLEEGQK